MPDQVSSTAASARPGEWEKRLWDLANTVVTFALAQSLVAGYAFGKEDFRDNFAKPAALVVALTLLAAVVGLELYVVQWCRKSAVTLVSNQDSTEFWNETTLGRYVAILFFALAPLLGLLGSIIKL